MNQDYLEQIEAYLNGEMSPVDQSLFESALASDKELSHTYKMYRTIEADMRGFEKYKLEDDLLKNTLSTLNKEYFKNEPQPATRVIPLYSNRIFKMAAAIAASIIFVLVSYFAFFRPAENMQVLADAYLKEHLQQISQTVSVPDDTLQFGVAGKHHAKDTNQDSLAIGITAYNNQEFNTALGYFRGVLKKYPNDKNVKKYTGLVYLHTQAYDQALREFDELANNPDLENNSALFLKAVTLMLRNQPGDKKEAKQLLQQVVKTHAEGSKEAAEWLQKL
ncbi:tetratricopeptide repeat protein [Adhaeribacter pallidiroseus]|uniref:Uncharacterized protein n=1 Tax=Adhaeribacter pallidiroseus TaxID=2072847 RepID=A0A369QAL3_9BACT|nr:tetratricopeptide repeat protein [Adhaeribacter pallidiroseus]RDC61951.1 hypothetical protein AHMF7616_00541 [Adhaeribacter pallidiroseus]